MRQSVKGGLLVSDHMGSPVLRYAHSDKAVQAHRGG